tara:strand:+ start:314 stop:1180 length:867 start_codon:yes stop_codon:yes gene_type:complete
MILVDLNQVMIGSLMAHLHRAQDEIDEGLVRHIVLNNLRHYRTKFKEKYGELVLCNDDKEYWRRDYFPNYKANRKKDRASSPYDWDKIFTCLNKVRDELKENFPYVSMKVSMAEADDIIAVLLMSRGDTKNIIVSSDKDFIQLHNLTDQYSPVTKKLVNGHKPEDYLREHILKGDRSDGIPNVLSADDTFVKEKRQRPMRKTTIVTLMEAMQEYDPETLHQIVKFDRDTWIRNWQRNSTLIDLTKIPKRIVINILKEFDEAEVPDRSNLLNYFVNNKLTELIEDIQEF